MFYIPFIMNYFMGEFCSTGVLEDLGALFYIYLMMAWMLEHVHDFSGLKKCLDAMDGWWVGLVCLGEVS